MSANLTLAVMTITVVAMLNYIGSGGNEERHSSRFAIT